MAAAQSQPGSLKRGLGARTERIRRPAAGTGAVDTRPIRAFKRAEASRLYTAGLDRGLEPEAAWYSVPSKYTRHADPELRRSVFPPPVPAPKAAALPRAIARAQAGKTFYTGRGQRRVTAAERATWEFVCPVVGCGLPFQTKHALGTHTVQANKPGGAHTLLAASSSR